MLIFAAIISCCVLSLSPAQPSGGPYGPLRLSYEVPAGAGTIFYAAPDGKKEETGTVLNRPTSIEAAIERVKTGDVIILRGGVYRTGDLILNQGITMQPYADEQPILKGTAIAANWKNLGNGLWSASWSRFFPAPPDSWWNRDRFGKETPLHLFNNDMVFLDGEFLQAVGREGEVSEHTYYIDYEAGRVYIGTDPANRLVEITAYNVALKRTIQDCHGKKSDGKGPVLRGITFTQYAYRAVEVEGKEPEGKAAETEYGKDVVGTTLEHCTLSFCSRVAAYLRGDRLTLRHCKVNDTSTEGIYIIASSDVLLEKNIFSRNNIERITGYYPAAVKIFNQTHRVTCRDNLVMDLPYSNGIWYDVGNVDGVFVNNWVEGVGTMARKFNPSQPWPSESGFFFEISKGAVCAGNVFVNCDQGIFILNSSDVRIYQNTFLNSTACIARNERSAANDATFGWHSSTGPDVHKRDGHQFVNNLLTGDEGYDRPLLFVWQSVSVCSLLTTPLLQKFDSDIFVRAGKGPSPLILWSPAKNAKCQIACTSLADIQKLHPEFLKQSRFFSDGSTPVFKSSILKNFQTVPEFPGYQSGLPLPEEIRTLLHQSQKNVSYIGAYPPLP